MNAPTSAVPSVVALAALRAVPSSFAIDASTPGLAGVLVLFKAPSIRPTPTTLRTAFEDAADRARPAFIHVDPVALKAAAVDDEARTAFLGSLPDVVSPVAALGLAVRSARDPGSEWVHVRTVEKVSQWTYCSSTVSQAAVSIHGAGTSAECYPDGRLTVDAGVPAHIATALRVAYEAARGVVEPSRIKALIGLYLARRSGLAITDDCYLLPDVTPTTCGILSGLVDLGGWAETVAVAAPERIARLSSPVSKSIEQQIADVVEATQAFIARAASVAAGDVVTVDGKSKPATMQKRTGEGVRGGIAEVRSRALLWRDRLSLASLDVDAQLDELDAAAERADRAALAAMDARRDAAKAAKADAPPAALPS